jgi:hypothetical protein
MTTLTVQLPDDLAEYVRRSVADGNFPSADALVTHAVGLVRTASVLGHGSTGEPVPRSSPGSVPSAPVDLTRLGFDSPSFLANLVGKLEQKRADDKRAEPR